MYYTTETDSYKIIEDRSGLNHNLYVDGKLKKKVRNGLTKFSTPSKLMEWNKDIKKKVITTYHFKNFEKHITEVQFINHLNYLTMNFKELFELTFNVKELKTYDINDSTLVYVSTDLGEICMFLNKHKRNICIFSQPIHIENKKRLKIDMTMIQVCLEPIVKLFTNSEYTYSDNYHIECKEYLQNLGVDFSGSIKNNQQLYY